MVFFIERSHLKLRGGQTVRIRAVRADDAGRFLTFFGGLSSRSRDFMHGWTQGCTPERANHLAARTTDADHRAIAAVTEGSNERIVGYCWIDGFGIADMPMLGIGIIDEYHEAGLGQTLLSLMVEWAGDLGATQIRLGVFADNSRGIHVYRKVGFIDDQTKPPQDFDGRIELYMVIRTGIIPHHRFPLLNLAGSHYDMGRRHGEAFRGQISSALAILPGLLPVPLPKAVKQAMLSLPYCLKRAPELVDEVQGIADGAGLTFEQVFTLNTSLDLQVSASTFGKPPPDCWAAAIPREGGSTVLWTAEDSPRWRDACVLLRLQPSDKPPCLLWTFAGFVGRPGLNPTLALAAAARVSDDCAPGLPYPFLCRKILACATTMEAVEEIGRYDRMRGMDYVIGDLTGDVAVLETTARTCRTAGHGGSYAFSSGRFADDRLARFIEMLPAADFTMMQRDHERGMLCAHDENGLATLTGFQIDVPAGDLYLTDGSPCISPYLRYSINI